MKIANLIRSPAKSILGFVAALVVASTTSVWAGPVLVPMKECSIRPLVQPTGCSDPTALCLPPAAILIQCRYVLRWVGCRDPELCVELNRQLACGMFKDRQVCVESLGLEQSNWLFLNDRSTPAERAIAALRMDAALASGSWLDASDWLGGN